MRNSTKYTLPLAAFIIIFFWTFQFKQHGITFQQKCNEKSDPFEFDRIASVAGTDKTTTHGYQLLYRKYLTPMRHVPVKMLEIGLGCDMDVGPGKSLYLWDTLFTHPATEIHLIEFDEKCLRKYEVENTMPYRVKFHAGNQENATFLKSFLTQHGHDFDIIIDDGGHTMTQQMTSFEYLFRGLKPGGLYFLEDLETSYMENFYGGGYLKPGTTVEHIKSMIDGFHVKSIKQPNLSEIASIHCMREMCVFERFSHAAPTL